MPLKESNYMRVRLVEPDLPDWVYIKKFAGDYYIASKLDPEATRFITLDVGKKGGLAFIRGVLPKKRVSSGPIESSWWATQSIRIEYRAIGLTTETSPIKAINALKKSKYWAMIIRHVERQSNQKIAGIKIISKGNDDFLLLIHPSEKVVSS